nr:DUF222 domain-containing protein [Mycolicibacterium doricum]
MLHDRPPEVAALFAAGVIHDPLVRAIVTRTALITDPTLMAAVDAALAEHIATWGPKSQKKTIDAIDEIHDPAALRRPKTPNTTAMCTSQTHARRLQRRSRHREPKPSRDHPPSPSRRRPARNQPRPNVDHPAPPRLSCPGPASPTPPCSRPSSPAPRSVRSHTPATPRPNPATGPREHCGNSCAVAT